MQLIRPAMNSSTRLATASPRARRHRTWARLLAWLPFALLASGCTSPPPAPVPRGSGAPCSDLTVGGFPEEGEPMAMPYFVCRKDTFALVYNPSSRTSLWVVERLTADAVSKPVLPHAQDFRWPPGIPAVYRPLLGNYRPAKGQPEWRPLPMADTLDFPGNQVQMSWSYYLSNTLPVAPDALPIMQDLAANIRAWAKARGEVFVVTGPVYYGGRAMAWTQAPERKSAVPDFAPAAMKAGAEAEKTHKGQMAVPAYIYKVVLDPRRREAVAFVIPNGNAPVAMLPKYATTLAQVEAMTHIRFFPGWVDRAAVESQVAGDWPLH